MTRPNGRSRTREFSGIPSESPGSGTRAPRSPTNLAEFTRSADAQSESPIRRSSGTDRSTCLRSPRGRHCKAASSPAAQDRRPSDGAVRAASPRRRRPTPGDQRRLYRGVETAAGRGEPRDAASRGRPGALQLNFVARLTEETQDRGHIAIGIGSQVVVMIPDNSWSDASPCRAESGTFDFEPTRNDIPESISEFPPHFGDSGNSPREFSTSPATQDPNSAKFPPPGRASPADARAHSGWKAGGRAELPEAGGTLPELGRSLWMGDPRGSRRRRRREKTARGPPLARSSRVGGSSRRREGMVRLWTAAWRFRPGGRGGRSS